MAGTKRDDYRDSIIQQTEDYKKFYEYLSLKYSPYTIRQYSDQYIRFIKSYGAPDDVTQETINSFMLRYSFNPDKISQNNPYYAGFIKSLIKCFELNVIVPKSERVHKTKFITEYKFLTKQEIDHIIDKAVYPINNMVRLMFETGMRLSEFVNTHRSQIDLSRNYISSIDLIDRYGTTKGSMGKNNKSFQLTFSDTSASFIKHRLEEIKKYEYPFHVGAKWSHDQARSFYYKLRKECRRIGLDKVHPHRIRHSLGYYLRADKGFDLEQIRFRLRHADISTTQIYSRATQKEVEDKMKNEVFE